MATDCMALVKCLFVTRGVSRGSIFSYVIIECSLLLLFGLSELMSPRDETWMAVAKTLVMFRIDVSREAYKIQKQKYHIKT